MEYMEKTFLQDFDKEKIKREENNSGKEWSANSKPRRARASKGIIIANNVRSNRKHRTLNCP